MLISLEITHKIKKKIKKNKIIIINWKVGDTNIKNKKEFILC